MNKTFKISYKIVDFLNKSLNKFQSFPGYTRNFSFINPHMIGINPFTQ